MNLAENLARDFPQVVGENQFTARLLFAGEIDRWKPVMVLQEVAFDPLVEVKPE